MWVVVPLALRPKSLDSLAGCLLQPADDLFGGYHLFGHLPEVDKRRLVAEAKLTPGISAWGTPVSLTLSL